MCAAVRENHRYPNTRELFRRICLYTIFNLGTSSPNYRSLSGRGFLRARDGTWEEKISCDVRERRGLGHVGSTATSASAESSAPLLFLARCTGFLAGKRKAARGVPRSRKQARLGPARTASPRLGSPRLGSFQSAG